MNKPDLNKIEFHAHVAVDREQIKQAKFDILKAKKDRQAEEFGRLIADTKGWKMEPEGPLAVCRLDVFVLTRNELRDWMDYHTKQKLIEMSNRETEQDIADRLILLSERV